MKQEFDFEELPECEFKFVYQKAIEPDYAESLIQDLYSKEDK